MGVRGHLWFLLLVFCRRNFLLGYVRPKI
jgi:hypothetical protein